MEKLKTFLRQFTETTPFILNNTMNLIPYLLYVHLVDGKTAISVLPFVLFYTFRMTGIFLVRGLYQSIEKYTLMMLALLLGSLGGLFTFCGMIYFPFYLLGAVGLGLSAAWLPPANASVNYFEKSQGFQNMTGKKYLLAFLLLVPLLWGLTLASWQQLLVVPGLVTLYFVLAYHTVRHYPHYELDFKDITKHVLSMRELTWFGLFFIGLFLLRSGRLLFNEHYLNLAILLFCFFFIAEVFGIHHFRQRWQLPLWQNLLTFVNGMIGNYLLLFGTFYVAAVDGRETLGWRLFFPYILGLVSALLLGGRVRRYFKNPLRSQLTGLALGLLLIMLPKIFSLGIFVLAFFQNSTNQWLNRIYNETQTIPENQRMTAKYATLNKGSILHQFLLMSLIALLLVFRGESVSRLLFFTSQRNMSFDFIMETVKIISSIGLCVILGIIERIGKNAFSN